MQKGATGDRAEIRTLDLLIKRLVFQQPQNKVSH